MSVIFCMPHLPSFGQSKPPSRLWISATAPQSTSGAILGAVLGNRLFGTLAHGNCATRQAADLLSHAEMIRELSGAGLSISTLAEIFDVTRPTIYSWQQETVPQKEKQNRIETVFQILRAIDPKRLALLSKVWNRKPQDSLSLYAALTAKQLNPADVKHAFAATEALFQKLIARQATPRKSVAETVEQTLTAKSAIIKEWDEMPTLGMEAI